MLWKKKLRAQIEAKIKEINDIPLLEDRDYGWVWQYAQVRFSQSLADVSRAEEKANYLLKIVVYGFSAFWALFVYFVKQCGLPVGAAFNCRIEIGLVGLCLSALLGLCGLLPVTTVATTGEHVPIRLINENREKSPKPQGRFALVLNVCSDFQEQTASNKSWCVLIGLVTFAVSLALLFAGFYSWMPFL